MNSYLKRYFPEYNKKSRFKKKIGSIGHYINNFRVNLTQYQSFSFKKQFDLRYWSSDDPPHLDYFEDFDHIRKHVISFDM